MERKKVSGIMLTLHAHINIQSVEATGATYTRVEGIVDLQTALIPRDKHRQTTEEVKVNEESNVVYY